MIDFYLFQLKWIPIPAFRVFLFGSVQGQEVWCNNSDVKITVEGRVQLFLTPLSSILSYPNKKLGWEGRLFKYKKEKAWELNSPDSAEKQRRGLCQKLLSSLSKLHREHVCWGAQRREVHPPPIHSEPQDPSPSSFSKTG